MSTMTTAEMTANPVDLGHNLLVAHLACVLDDMTTNGLADLTAGECVAIASALSRSLNPEHRETWRSADGKTVGHVIGAAFDDSSYGSSL